MIEVSNLRIPLSRLDGTEKGELAACRKALARKLGIREGRIQSLELRRRSIDARKRSSILLTFTVRATIRGDESELTRNPRNNARLAEVDSYRLPSKIAEWKRPQPVVIGAGCAGLFCTLALASAGLRPILIERGDDARRRIEVVRRFESTGELDTESNIQFGLGGAGTFSDGKLSTGTRSPAHRLILEILVEAGAQRRILWDAKPHVGSDVLPDVVTRVTQRIRELGGDVRFRTRLTGLDVDDRGVCGITVRKDGTEEHLVTNDVVLACGHSARDVFCILRDSGVALERKTFAVGARIEHLQKDVDKALYGRNAGHPALGAAPYKLAEHGANGRSVFSFCMCPGGYVVAATSERKCVVTNGMSLSTREGANANSALLANVFPDDLPGDDILAGVDFQTQIEKAAFDAGMNSGNPYAAPAQLVGDFLQGVSSTGPGSVQPTYPLGVSWSNGCETCLPDYVSEPLRAAIPRFERKLACFAARDAVLTGVESRSSSPVRVVRTKEGQSVNTPGLWPCGEGAGYAGGIMSAATDGLNIADAIVSRGTGT